MKDGLREDYPPPEIARRMRYKVHERVGAYWSVPDDFLQRSHFDRVVLGSIDWRSSPGFPYRLKYSDNRSFFGVVDGVPNSMRMDEIWSLVELRLQCRDNDPIYLFVKQEPHKLNKMGRKRLISSVSIIDQIIDHMLDDPFNQAVVDKALFGAIKAGWTHLLGGWKVLPRGGLSIDKSAWDWTMRWWLCCMCYEIREGLCLTKGKLFESWREHAAWRYRSLFSEARFALPDGTIWRQASPGVMKSGSVKTIVDNSIAQLLLHERVLCDIDSDIEDDWVYAMGDDTYQQVPRNLKQYLDSLGQYCVVKEWGCNNEFAGNRFISGRRIEPLYKGKHAYKLLYADPKIQCDLPMSYSLLYHRSEDREAVRSILENFGPCPTGDRLDEIYDGE